MKFGFLVVLAFATPVCAAEFDLSTKGGCLRTLSTEAVIADAWERIPDYRRKELSKSPDSAKNRAEKIAGAYDEIREQYRIVSNELLALCNSYD